MRLLLLGSGGKRLHNFLVAQGDVVLQLEAPLHTIADELSPEDIVISYGYRHLIRKESLDVFVRPPINLHISLLPYNQGADPNLWSFLENSPKGVTIHEIDSGLDTGRIIFQKEVSFSAAATLKSSYDQLSLTIETLFMSQWHRLRCGNYQSLPQPKGGSCHRASDKSPYLSLLHHGWDTPVADLVGKALNHDHSDR